MKQPQFFYKKFNILEFKDLVSIQNCLFTDKLEQGKQLSKSFIDIH